MRGAAHFEKYGDAGLESVVRRELKEAEAYVERVMHRRVLASGAP